MIWYKVNNWGELIEQVEVAKETDKYIIYPSGRKDVKSGRYTKYFQTEAEAKKYILNRAETNLIMAKNNLHKAEEELAKVHQYILSHITINIL